VKKEGKKAVIGGTFEILHPGHKALLKRAFKLGRVTIGLTSDAFARKLKKRKVKNFKLRKKELTGFIESQKRRGKALAKIVKIENRFGPTLRQNFDYIVVSPETYETALLINRNRQKTNKKPIKIIKIKFVLDKDGKPFSSTAQLARYKKNPDRQDVRNNQ